MLIPIETNRICEFPGGGGGGPDPLSTIWFHECYQRSHNNVRNKNVVISDAKSLLGFVASSCYSSLSIHCVDMLLENRTILDKWCKKSSNRVQVLQFT